MTRHSAIALAGTILLALPAFADAARVTIRRNTVVPVVFQDTLSMKDNRRGDTFTATVDGDRDLPHGTRILGRVANIREKRGNDPAYMDLEFHTILLPDGSRTRIQAVPISLDQRYVTRDREGRFQAKPEVIRRDTAVIGSTIGGLLIGSLMKKPFEGAFVGALAGIVLAETQNAGRNGDVTVRRGAKLGAMFERDVTLNIDDRLFDRRYDNRNDDRWDDRFDNRRDDRFDDRRDDRWDDRYDNRRDDRWDDRWDDRGAFDPRLNVAYRGRELRFGRDEEPYRIGNTLMVPLEATARQMNLRVSTQRNSRVIELDDRGVQARLEQGSRNYSLNGRRETLPQALVDRRGVIYAPIELFARIRTNEVTVNGTRVR
jgi:hypothetical protein